MWLSGAAALAFNKMPVIFDCFSAGWALWIMVILLLE